ncbi:hypothetical protein C7974DRAFT_423707 [Boeremia exigua]|uniref:uncharacterized protein n=1 Tax=Boeremia exigua TaxID=749465 RepID=UPI001E8CD950|nr:uncharacterized protein C7974DRAFT_423707 [Boeremia exigua]KAH6633349.1 hypothetical protein C7974DRAFT_423707 [Boeremia exigua]
MAPSFGRGGRHTAHRNARDEEPCHISSANNTQLSRQAHHTPSVREGDRARQTQRKRNNRDRRNKLKVPRSPSPTVRRSRLIDRMTYSHTSEARDPTSDSHATSSLSRSQQGRSYQRPDANIHSNGFTGDGKQGKASYTYKDSSDITGMEVDVFADLFGPGPPPPRPPRPLVNDKSVQYGSNYNSSARINSDCDLTFNLDQLPLHSVQPATRREPIRMINTVTSHESNVSLPTSEPASDVHSTSPLKTPESKKHPFNPYKGRNFVMRRVQNKRLQNLLLDKPMPKPRKNLERMVLKCTGKQEFR